MIRSHGRNLQLGSHGMLCYIVIYSCRNCRCYEWGL